MPKNYTVDRLDTWMVWQSGRVMVSIGFGMGAFILSGLIVLVLILVTRALLALSQRHR